MDTLETHARLSHYDVGFDVPDDTASRVAVEVHWPEAGPVSSVTWFCLPGGGMNRRFYNLDGGDAAFSFARRMAARGFVSVLVDPPGIGDSDRPADGYALTPERLTMVLTRVHERVCDDLRAGRVDPALPAIGDVQTVGVGHSMGALLTVLHQAEGRPHAGLALLGFGLAGLPRFLPPRAQELATDTQALRAELPELAQQMFQVPYPDVGSGGDGDLYGGAEAEPEAVAALRAARDHLLPVPALMSILPGNVAPEAAAVDVPVYLSVGERDLVELPDDAAADFAASPAVEQQVLAGAGHSFFLFAARTQLFDGLASWACGLTTTDQLDESQEVTR